MSSDMNFTKDNLDMYLKELAKEYKKRNRHIPAELILVGGASVLINYGFREMTTDIDAIVRAESVMKETINYVGDKFGLPNGWINTDFTKTDSYSQKLIEHSQYYRTYSNLVEIRTVKAEYLIAMKLIAGRKYKKDLSDIVGILNEQKKQGAPLSYEMINKAVIELYGDWNKIDKMNIELLKAALEEENLDDMFTSVMKEEQEAKSIILEIDKNYPDVVKADNINEILEKAKAKKKQ